MRKIIANTQSSLDGFIDNPHLWIMPYMDQEVQAHALELALRADTLLLGRVTFEGMAQAWPGQSNPYADHVNAMRKYAVSSTLEKAEWENSSIIRGEDLIAEVTALKEQPGKDIVIWGCGRLTDALREHGLLDEYHILVAPVVVGGSQRLWSEGTQATMELVDSKTFGSGLMAVTYRPTKG